MLPQQSDKFSSRSFPVNPTSQACTYSARHAAIAAQLSCHTSTPVDAQQIYIYDQKYVMMTDTTTTTDIILAYFEDTCMHMQHSFAALSLQHAASRSMLVEIPDGLTCERAALWHWNIKGPF